MSLKDKLETKLIMQCSFYKFMSIFWEVFGMSYSLALGILLKQSKFTPINTRNGSSNKISNDFGLYIIC